MVEPETVAPPVFISQFFDRIIVHANQAQQLEGRTEQDPCEEIKFAPQGLEVEGGVVAQGLNHPALDLILLSLRVCPIESFCDGIVQKLYIE